MKGERQWELPLVEIGIIYINTDRPELARTHMEDVFQDTENPSWHLLLNLGEARRRCDDPAAALEAYEAGITLNPNHADMIDRAAHCAFLVGDSVKGRRLAKEAHQLGSSETFQDWQSGKFRRKPR